jgi:hypothetical protein
MLNKEICCKCYLEVVVYPNPNAGRKWFDKAWDKKGICYCPYWVKDIYDKKITDIPHKNCVYILEQMLATQEGKLV